MSARHRPSLLGALLWIGFGVLFLLRNFGIGPSFWSIAGRYWPILLILLGLGKILDYCLKKETFSIRIGEIVGIFILLIVGSAITKISETRVARFFRDLPVEVGDTSIQPGQWIGDSYSYTEEATYTLDRSLPVRIENSYGAVSVAPGREGEIHVRLKKVIYGDEARARQMAPQIRLEGSQLKTPEASWFVIKTNRDSLSPQEGMFNTDLEVMIPKNSRLEISNSFGEVSVFEINGYLDLKTTHRKLEVRDCTGTFNLTNRYGESRLANLNGNVTLTSRGKAYIENITGDVTINSEFSPLEIYHVKGKVSLLVNENGVHLEDITGPVIIEARGARVKAANIRDNLRITASYQSVDISDVAANIWLDSRFAAISLQDIKGNIEINSNSDRVTAGDLEGSFKLNGRATSVKLDDIRGPVDIQTSLKDVAVKNLQDNCSISNEYADISVTVETLGKGGIAIRNRNGAIDLALPANASFILDATAKNGQLESRYPGLEPPRKDGNAVILRSKVGGGGPRVVLETMYDNIRIEEGRLHKGSPDKPNKKEKITVDIDLFQDKDYGLFRQDTTTDL